MSIINIDVFAFNDFTTAIQSAQVGDTINFFIQNDIVFPSAVGITKTLTINLINATSGNVTLSVPAGNTFRHFTTGVAPIPNVSMTVGSGIIIDGGGTGGGLFIFGSNCSVTLNGCTFSNCRSSLNGGALQVLGDTARSTLVINDDTLITTCSAIFGGGVVASGCNVTLNGGTIIGNTASNAGGGMSVDGRSAALGSTLTINGVTITGNTATVNDGGGINAQNTIITILGGEISNNMAMGFGGGIHVFSSIVAQSALIINGGTIIGNSTRNFGGGIGVQSRISELTMTNGLITQNSAVIPVGSNQGGGIYVQEGNTFEMSGGIVFNNTAGSGGGIFLNNSTLNLNGTAEVSGNEATTTAGGIYGFQGCTVNVFGDAKVIDNTALCSGDPTRQDRGGGGIAILSFGTTSTATIRDNAVISGNTSVSYGGGIWTYPNFGPATFVNIEGGTIENNMANFGGGISMGEIPGDTPVLTITGGTITNNSATTDGGGIIAKGSLVSVANCSITNNTAGHDGGGIWIAYAELANLTVASDVIFSGNKASRAFNRNPIDDALYFSHIFATHWTVPFTQGYNNFDISYTNGTPFVFPTDVTIVKTANPNPVNPGEILTYTINISNAGPSDAENVVLNDSIPPSIIGPEFSVDGGVTFNPWTGSFLIGTLLAGETRTIIIRGIVSSSATEIITNTATVTTTTPLTSTSVTTSTVNTQVTVVPPVEADVSVEKIASLNPVIPGEVVTFILVVSNAGPNDAENVIVNDNVSPSIIGPEFSTNGGVTFNPWTGSINIGTLPVGASETILIRGTVSPTATGCINNTVIVTSTTPDPNLLNNVSAICVEVRKRADISVKKKGLYVQK